MLSQKPTPLSISSQARGATPNEAKLIKSLLSLAERLSGIAKTRGEKDFSDSAKTANVIRYSISQLSFTFKTIPLETVTQVYLRELEKMLESNPTVLCFVLLMSERAASDEMRKIRDATMPPTQPLQVQPTEHSSSAAQQKQEQVPTPTRMQKMRKFFSRLLGLNSTPPLAGSAPTA